ncbi:MAG: 30S ribosomal protein S11 [Candidatus Sungiibacteriota bacterium]|uniref:Small ribosomal subunit protein uS11 n=1 Tax=Candidatus Sungiibacteriota bacterium TaxID=2750080 RepID=A0A7T5RK03_9BACT|nr:MAG: 30S ribosomal protein S11 [Candidatus Sungbacteria bacterium]
MGKKRIIKKGEESVEKETAVSKPQSVKSPQKLTKGIVHIQATYNNTLISITDEKGNMIAWSSAGSLGFSGAKKATPFAAARVAETVVEKVRKTGLQEVAVRVSGVGSGRDSAIRALANQGLSIAYIKDVTPLPHNGPRPPKLRRV